jgi:hypothetical protein
LTLYLLVADGANIKLQNNCLNFVSGVNLSDVNIFSRITESLCPVEYQRLRLATQGRADWLNWLSENAESGCSEKQKQTATSFVFHSGPLCINATCCVAEIDNFT